MPGLLSSIAEIGLQTPITVRIEEDMEVDGVTGVYVLITGRHRVEAYRRMGEDYIPSIVRRCSEDDAKLWEIAENLHRAELTSLEKSEQIAEWVRITEKKLRESQEPEVKPQGGRPESGVRAASRELGLPLVSVQRAIKIDGLSSEAKRAAQDAGLDKHPTILEKAKGFGQGDPDKEQEYIHKAKEERIKSKAARPSEQLADDKSAKELASWLAGTLDYDDLVTLTEKLKSVKLPKLVAALEDQCL